MEHEQAQEAAQATQAAPEAGAGNGRERAKSSLLEQMTEPQPGNTPEDGVARSGVDDNASGAGAEDPPAGEAAVEASGDSGDATEGDADALEDTGDDGRAKPKNFRNRWNHLNDQERRVVELATKRGLTLAEAYRAVYGNESAPIDARSGQAPGDAGAESAPAPLAELDRQIGDQERQINDLKRLKSAAKNDLAAYDQASEAYLEAREQLRGLQDQRRQEALRHQTAADEARKRAEEVAQAAVAEEFPEALTPGTELHDACAEEIAYLRDTNNPLIRDPQLQYKVARRMARTLGSSGRAQNQGAGTPQETASSPSRSGAVAPKRTVRPVPAGGSPVEAPAMALERRVADARSSDAMLHLMREFGTPFEALLKQ